MTKPKVEVKLISPGPDTKKLYLKKGMYSSLFSKITKKDRESAWEKGMVI